MTARTHRRREPPEAGLLPFPARVARTRLANGLRVVAIETPHLHGAAAGLYVATGSRFEDRRNNGLSHFVEHMLFRGSAGFPAPSP